VKLLCHTGKVYFWFVLCWLWGFSLMERLDNYWPGRFLNPISHCFTMSNMRTAKTVSITLPPELLVKAQEFAQREHRTMSELFREALRRYMTSDEEWNGVLQRTRAAGRSLGVTTEEDVERLSDEYRHNHRR
jgi:Arc/MetJ-type ribon-helix-helix transcriptional regulator